jgi:peptidyl-prolyl cis-trans isomerase SurA
MFKTVIKHCFSFLTALFAAASLQVSAETILLDEVVAIVDDDVIMASELKERLLAAYDHLDNKGSASPAPSKIVRDQILERLILESLQLQLAERASIVIPDEDVERTFNNIAAKNNLSPAEFTRTMRSQGMSVDNFKKSIRNEMTIQTLQKAALRERIQVTDQEITNFLNSEEGKLRSADAYRLAHIVVPVTENNSKESAAALAADLVQQARSGASFSSLAKKHSKAPDSENGGQLGFLKKAQMPALYATEVSRIKDGEISDPIETENAFYILQRIETKSAENRIVKQTQVNHILVKTNEIRDDAKAEELLKQVRSRVVNDNEDFAELAKEFSEDYGNSLKGGSLGWVTPGMMVEEFEQVMNATEAGSYSQPFKSRFGWHIIYVSDRREEDMSEEYLENTVRNFLMQRRFEEELPRWLNELRNEAYIDIKIQ